MGISLQKRETAWKLSKRWDETWETCLIDDDDDDEKVFLEGKTEAHYIDIVMYVNFQFDACRWKTKEASILTASQTLQISNQ